ncbi:helix-turn-helix domain-containing protein [Pendulispora brunnea]|uniref:Helix-turn-helix domain-containing protein n=1 Tax=Pendulispora brunnea TaxID=2905690 RepID=A0ABZ2KQT4_9BACT
MKISVLALEDVFDTGLSAVLDTLETANELAGECSRYDVRCVGVRAKVCTHQGFEVRLAAKAHRAPDLVVVPALACKQPETIVAALARADVADAVKLLARWRAGGARIAAACTGTFVLGRAGLLDGHRATTSWWLGPTFRREFPSVELDHEQMVIADRGALTAGAALAHVDLALTVIRERSPNLADLVARHLLVEDRASQAPFIAPGHIAHDDDLVKRFETWTRRHIAESFDLARAARAVGASERTLQRRIRMVLGKSPIAFVQDLRLERAAHLLRTTRDNVDNVARSVGYEDGATLRVLIRRKLRTSARNLRRTG